MDDGQLRILELCAGLGGLGLGVKIAVPSAQVVGAVEWSAYCTARWVERMEDEAVEPAALWPDLDSFAAVVAPRLRTGFADLIAAGFPCQPWSQAGRRCGIKDERWIWSTIRRIVALMRPEWVFLENTPGLERDGLSSGRALDFDADESAVGNGLRIILRDLAALGYDAEWDCISAGECGANHIRFRIFILARLADAELRRWSGWQGWPQGGGWSQESATGPQNGGSADATQFGSVWQRRTRRWRKRPPNDNCESVRDAMSGNPGSTDVSGRDIATARNAGRTTDSSHSPILLGPEEFGSAAHRDAPGHGEDASDAQGVGQQDVCTSEEFGFGQSQEQASQTSDPLSKRFPLIERQHGDDGEERPPAERDGSERTRRNAEPAIRRMDAGFPAELGEGWWGDWPHPPLSTGEPDRAEQLCALGNAVIPEQCAYALALLAERAGWGRIMTACKVWGEG